MYSYSLLQFEPEETSPTKGWSTPAQPAPSLERQPRSELQCPWYRQLHHATIVFQNTKRFNPLLYNIDFSVCQMESISMVIAEPRSLKRHIYPLGNTSKFEILNQSLTMIKDVPRIPALQSRISNERKKIKFVRRN